MDAGRGRHHSDGRDADGGIVTPAANQSRASRRWGTGSVNLGARQPVSHAIMFYLLSFLAMVIFAPCVLVPIWQDVQRLREAQRAAAARVAQLRQQIERNNRRIEALNTDPLVIERVARRELNQHPADEQHVRWTPAELAALRLNLPHDLTQSAEPPPMEVPAWVDRVGRWLPAWAWSDVFGKSPNRQIVLVMAGCLLLTAFVLYTPRGTAARRGT